MYQFGIEIDSPEWKYIFMETKELIFTEFISDTNWANFSRKRRNQSNDSIFTFASAIASEIWRSLSCESRNKLENRKLWRQLSYCIIEVVCLALVLRLIPMVSTPKHWSYSHSAVVLTGSTLCKFPESKVESKVNVPTSNFMIHFKDLRLSLKTVLEAPLLIHRLQFSREFVKRLIWSAI